MASAMVDFGFVACFFLSPLCPVSGHWPIFSLLLCLLLVCVCAHLASTGLIFTQTDGIKQWSLVLMLWSLVLVTGVGLKQ